MTVTTSVDSITYGNGQALPVPFLFLADSDLVVTNIDGSGVETPLENGVDYTVEGAGYVSGGTVTLSETITYGEQVRIDRVPAFNQPYEFRESAAFDGALVEKALDNIVLQTINLNNRLGDLEEPPPPDISQATVLSAGSLVARTLQARFSDEVFFDDFWMGALDGSEDCNEAFTAAVTAAKASSTHRLILPAGTILLSGDHDISNLELIGAWGYDTILKAASGVTSLLTSTSGFALRDIVLNGSNIATSLIAAPNCSNNDVLLERVQVQNSTGTAVSIGVALLSVRTLEINSTGSIGLDINGAYLMLEGLRISVTNSSGFSFADCLGYAHGIYVEEPCLNESGTGTAMILDGCEPLAMSSVELLLNTADCDGILFDTSNQVSIDGLKMVSNVAGTTTKAIRMTGSCMNVRVRAANILGHADYTRWAAAVCDNKGAFCCLEGATNNADAISESFDRGPLLCLDSTSSVTYFNGRGFYSNSVPPSAGIFPKFFMIWGYPVYSNVMFWINTTGGSPGTWLASEDWLT